MEVSLYSPEKTKFAVKHIMFIAFLICLFNINSYAQKPAPCPKIQFVTPTYEVEAGTPVTLEVNVTGGDPNASITYNWSVSAGSISSGQGTSNIVIDTQGVEVGGTITATVELGGIAPQCQRTNSRTVEVLAKRKPAVLKVYEGKYVSNADLEKQIDELIMARIVTQGNGYIIFYAGRKAPAAEVKRLTDVAKARIKKNKVDAALFIIIEGGTGAETAFELWAAGVGADPPQPSPKK